MRVSKQPRKTERKMEENFVRDDWNVLKISNLARQWYVEVTVSKQPLREKRESKENWL